MGTTLSIDELAEIVHAQIGKLEISEKVKAQYRLHLMRLVASYKHLSGSSEFSPDALKSMVSHYRDQLSAGSLSRESFTLLRRTAADIEDVATTGAISHEEKLSKWPLPQKQLKTAAPAAGQNVYENVAVLSTLVLSMMERAGWSTSTLRSYRASAFPRIVAFFQEHGTMRYSEELIELVIEESGKSLGAPEDKIGKMVWRAAKHMQSVHNAGTLCDERSTRDSRITRSKETWLGPIVEEFEQWRLASGITPSTIRVNLNYIIPFLEQLSLDGPEGFKHITREQVRGARAALSEGRTPKYVARVVGGMRLFSRFAEERHPEFVLFGDWIGQKPRVARQRPIEGYSVEQTDRIVACVDDSTDIGKRDLAVVKLLQTTGLRSCDIAGLTLEDIDWYSNEITVVQRKTGIPIALPLVTEAGEALATYILDARRATGSPAVFVSAIGPVRPLSAAVIGNIARKYGVMAADGDFQGTHGSHAFRRGLGTMLVEAGIPMSDVANMLGQVDVASAMPYVALATERLRECCAGLDNVPIKRKGA